MIKKIRYYSKGGYAYIETSIFNKYDASIYSEKAESNGFVFISATNPACILPKSNNVIRLDPDSYNALELKPGVTIVSKSEYEEIVSHHDEMIKQQGDKRSQRHAEEALKQKQEKVDALVESGMLKEQAEILVL